MKNIIYSLVVSILISCQEENGYLPTNFAYDIAPVEITEDVNVGAYYYNYSDEDWTDGYSHSPLLGEYDAVNSDVMDQHRKWADIGGIDFFIFTWNGSTEDDDLLNSFVTGNNSEVKMVINYNTSHLGLSNSSPLTGDKLTTMINEFEGFASSHFNQDYYYKVDGEPVILFTPLNLSSSKAESIDFHTVIPALRQAMNDSGFNPYIIGEITSGWLPPQRYSQAIKTVDAVSLKEWATDNYDRSIFFPPYIDQNWKHWNDSTSLWKIDFVPVILPGYDDKVMNPDSKIYNLGQDENFFIDMSNVAKGNMGTKRIVLINSWNDFKLGTTIEPAEEYGDTLLELLQKQFKIN